MKSASGYRYVLRVIRAGGLLFGLAGVVSASCAHEFSLSIDDVQSPAFSATGISAIVKGDALSQLEVGISRLRVQDKSWKNVKLSCPAAEVKAHSVTCSQGMLRADKESVPVSFAYSSAPRMLALTLNFPQKERWQLAAQFEQAAWQGKLTLVNASASRFAQWLPDSVPHPGAGKINGVVSVSATGNKQLQANLDLRVSRLAFTDAAGLHAGEKVDGVIKASATQQGDAWRWRADLNWLNGEVFWQPLYFPAGGHALQAQGKLDAQNLVVDSGTLTLGGVGKLDVSGKWARAGYLDNMALHGSGLDLPALYTLLLKPYLEKTILASLETQGKIDLDWRYRDRATRSVDLRLHHVFAKDEKQRFALDDIDGLIPWSNNGSTRADISLKGAQWLNIPLGEMHIPLQMNGMNFSLPQLTVPVLDGKLNLADFKAGLNNGAWEWQFSGGLSPVSMEQFSRVMKLPLMHGAISGVIPEITYNRQGLHMDGALLFKVFDGTVVLKDLSMIEPLGRAPRLNANLDMRNLDLGLLTRAFSFGSMDGRIDVTVKDIELSDWTPVQFDALVQSSPGSYRKQISQRAVQNISSLGGAGAAAAIQRSFLSFFEQFGYSKIGMSCVLRNGVCVMGGVEEAPQGYVIVKGGGIPAITVIGYNRYVSWNELLDRLKRITQSNVKPIIQ